MEQKLLVVVGIRQLGFGMQKLETNMRDIMDLFLQLLFQQMERVLLVVVGMQQLFFVMQKMEKN